MVKKSRPRRGISTAAMAAIVVLIVVVAVAAYFAGTTLVGPPTTVVTTLPTTTVVTTAPPTTVVTTAPTTIVTTAPPTTVVTTVPKRADRIIIGTTDKVADNDPAEAYDFYTWEILTHIAEGLLTYKPGTTDLEPGLAESMPTVSADGLEWTFKLRPNLKFTDGTPCDAEAVKWTIDRQFTIEGDPSWLVTGYVDHVEVVDPLTIKFVLNGPYGFFPQLAASVPYHPVNPNGDYPADEYNSTARAGGVGPYIITSWIPDVEMILKANPDYYGPQPETPIVVVRFFADATTLRLSLEAGEIDVAWRTIRPADLQDLRGKPDLDVVEVPGPYIRYLIIETYEEPVDDVLVRRALAAALDREAINEKVFLGTTASLYSMVPNGMWSHEDIFLEKYGEANIDLAKDFLTQAGYSETNKVEVELWYTPTHYGDTEVDVAALVKESWEKTGMISVDVKSTEWATYLDYMDDGAMPVYLLGWYPDYIDPDNYLASFLHSGVTWTGAGGPEQQYGCYWDDEMDRLLEDAAEAPTIEERTALYEQVQEKLADDSPLIPIFQGTISTVSLKGVHGVVLDPTQLLRYWLIYREL